MPGADTMGAGAGALVLALIGGDITTPITGMAIITLATTTLVGAGVGAAGTAVGVGTAAGTTIGSLVGRVGPI